MTVNPYSSSPGALKLPEPALGHRRIAVLLRRPRIQEVRDPDPRGEIEDQPAEKNGTFRYGTFAWMIWSAATISALAHG